MFGIIKPALGFRQFSLRGLDKVRVEWSLVTMARNLKRMFVLAPARPAAKRPSPHGKLPKRPRSECSTAHWSRSSREDVVVRQNRPRPARTENPSPTGC